MGKLLRAEPEGPKFMEGYPSKGYIEESKVAAVYPEIQRLS